MAAGERLVKERTNKRIDIRVRQR